jgi:hypothetical protein
MNKVRLTGIAVAAALTGCASTPMPNAALENARTVVATTEADPNVARYAALDIEAARKQLAIAESAALNNDQETASQAGYLASQTARLAELRATAKADDAHVANGQAERDRIQLAARNRELSQAQTAQSEAAARAAQLEAEAAALKAKSQQ